MQEMSRPAKKKFGWIHKRIFKVPIIDKTLLNETEIPNSKGLILFLLLSSLNFMKEKEFGPSKGVVKC